VTVTDSEVVAARLQDSAVRLRVEVYGPIARARGYKTVVSQAAWHGLARSAMFRLLAGGAPSASTALRIAGDLGVPVEAIWERAAA
jgi:DNA-binding phage protein